MTANERTGAGTVRSDGPTGPYELRQPVLSDAYAALRHLFGHRTTDIWEKLLADAGLHGQETDLASFDRMVDAMRSAEPVVRLCGRGLAIRSTTYVHLCAAHALIRDAE